MLRILIWLCLRQIDGRRTTNETNEPFIVNAYFTAVYIYISFSLLLYVIIYNAMALIRVPFVHGFYSLCTDQMKWLSAHTGFNISTMLVFHASQNFSGWKLASWFNFCCYVLCVALKFIPYEIDTNLVSLPTFICVILSVAVTSNGLCAQLNVLNEKDLLNVFCLFASIE